jgi:undecaprenyl-diphosphatase
MIFFYCQVKFIFCCNALKSSLTKKSFSARIKTQMSYKLPPLSTQSFVTMMALMLASFSFLTYKVLDENTIKFDTRLNELIATTRTPRLNYWMNMITDVGQIGGLVFTLILGSILWYKNKWKTAVALVSSVFGAAFLTEFLKLVFNRERPAIASRLATEFTFGFPSGHATASFALFPILAILFYTQVDIQENYKRLVVFLLSVFPFVVGYSRLYMGVHYVTDVVAGSIVGLSFASIFYYTYNKSKK